ncbi:MAG TPA: class I SAM-dependent methyltransferase [Rhizomicrobium sp.]|nr:class I SAM-dependent methyltransferase [Rhizomicrobium sp.]
MSNRITPEQIATIKPEHLKWMFGDFHEMIQARIEELRRLNHALSTSTVAFFEYLLREVDAEKFARIQRTFLSAESRTQNGNMLKYIDPITWFESKLNNARWIGLDNQRPLRILDLGTGPGHFPVVARFYGHLVVGTDLPDRSRGLVHDGHLYDALCDLYHVERISHRIFPSEPLGEVGGRYDLLTAFLAAFNIDEEKRPWSVDQWRFFLLDLKENILNDGGVLCMTLDDAKLTPDSWSFLRNLSEKCVERKKQILISDFSNL